MTEVTLYEDRPAPDPTGGRLVAWASSLTAAKQIGAALCNTSFVPATFKGKPEEAAAAILYGDEIGLSPTQSLQSVYVISGKPALYARAMVAVVLAAGHEIETVKKAPTEVTVRGRRRGSDNWTTETWTMARATKAGYTNNKKYASDPEAMLYSRAAADICRQIAPDALAGIGYSVEELETEPTKVTVVRDDRPAEGPRAIRRNAAPEPVEPPLDEPTVDTETGEIVDAEIVETVPEPPLDEPPPDEGEPPARIGAGDFISKPQQAKMRVLLNALGMTEREAILAYVSGIVGRQVETSNSLTKTEAGAVIDALEALVDLTPKEES